MKDTGVWYDSLPKDRSAKFRLASKNKLVYLFEGGGVTVLPDNFFSWDREHKRQLTYIELTEW